MAKPCNLTPASTSSTSCSPETYSFPALKILQSIRRNATDIETAQFHIGDVHNRIYFKISCTALFYYK